MKGIRIQKLPRAKDIDFVRPDRADVIKGKRQVDEQKSIGAHGSCSS
jgi:hypothetical protein